MSGASPIIYMNVYMIVSWSRRYPQTLLAVSTTSSSFRFCSSGVSMFPGAVEANPHCGLSARFSTATYLAASSMRRKIWSCDSNCGFLELIRPKTTTLSGGMNRSGFEAPCPLGVILQQKSVHVERGKGALCYYIVAAFGTPGAAIVAPAHVHGYGDARTPRVSQGGVVGGYSVLQGLV